MPRGPLSTNKRPALLPHFEALPLRLWRNGVEDMRERAPKRMKHALRSDFSLACSDATLISDGLESPHTETT